MKIEWTREALDDLWMESHSPGYMDRKELEKAKARIERLETALRKILELDPDGGYGAVCSAHYIAHEALGMQ